MAEWNKMMQRINKLNRFVKKNNDFIVSYIGAIDNNARDADAATTRYVEEAVNALLDGKAVPLEKTKAIGCGIKYRKSGS